MTRILLVEDEIALSEPLSFLLEREGYEVEVAADGPAAIAAFDRAGADLVLLDLMLPGLPGTEVCRELRSRSNVPIIMLTAKDSEIDIVVGLELGADDYQREGEQQQAAHHHHCLAHRQDGASVHAVRELPTEETQGEEGDELRQPRVTERERAAGEFVDLPADGHRFNLHRQHRAQARQQVEAKVPVMEDGASGDDIPMSHAGAAVIQGRAARHSRRAAALADCLDRGVPRSS